MNNSRILDLFVKKDNVKTCKFLCNSLIFDFDNKVKCCPLSDYGVFKDNFDGIWLDVESLVEKRNNLILDFNKGIYPEKCSECSFNKTVKKQKIKPFEYLILSNWKYCYLNCSYCNAPKEEDLIKIGHYDVYNSIYELVDKKLVTQKTKIIFDSGDATVHPEFDKLMYYFINLGMQDIVVNTPAMRYCESISEAISKNICELVVSFDCGCPYIYQKVKGLNKFDIAVANIKRYLSFQLPSEKRVVLKYTIVNGVNDNQKEILDWFMLAGDLGIKKLALDIDAKWFDELKYFVPQYLKDLLEFVSNMSEYNDIEIEFCDKVDIIYKSIKKNNGD